MIRKNAVWLITGCSRGLGRALVQQALHSTYRVVVTARDLSTVDGLVKAHSETALGVELDVTKPDQIKAAIAAAEDRFGSVDVLVNNAGYGYFGAIEEGEDAGVRAVFEANVFGPVNLVKAVLPGMRARKHGHIVNMSSVGGMVTYPAAGYYHMTKFALEALSETLAKEVSPFGIGVTVVEPGAFLTDFRASTPEKQSVTRLSAYADTAGKARDNVFANHRKQQGDPMRGAKVIIAAVEADYPPLHLVMGVDALDQIRQKLAGLQRDLDTWQELTRSTSFEKSMNA